MRFPFDCTGCGRKIVRPQGGAGKGLALQARGLCGSCYYAWRDAGRPEPVARFRRVADRQWHRFPFDCVGCGRQIVRSRGQAGEGLAHVAHGLCVACHSAWVRAGRPEPVGEFRHIPKGAARREKKRGNS